MIAEQELAKAQDRSRLQTLTAPLDGTVQQVTVHTIGGIVQAAQTLIPQFGGVKKVSLENAKQAASNSQSQKWGALWICIHTMNGSKNANENQAYFS